jgi:hypothetical protein
VGTTRPDPEAAAAAAAARAAAAADAEFADLVDVAAHLAALWLAMERAEAEGARDSGAYRAAERAATAILRQHPVLHLIAARLRLDDRYLSGSAALAAFVRADDKRELADRALDLAREYSWKAGDLLRGGDVHPLVLPALAAAVLIRELDRFPFELLLGRTLIELGDRARGVAAIEASGVPTALKQGLIQALTDVVPEGTDVRAAYRDALAATGRLVSALDAQAAAQLAELRRAAELADLQAAYDEAMDALDRGEDPLPPLPGAPSVVAAMTAGRIEVSAELFRGHPIPYAVLLMLLKAKEDTLFRLCDGGLGAPHALPNPSPAEGYSAILDLGQLRALADDRHALDLSRTDGPLSEHSALFRLLAGNRPEAAWQAWDALSRALVSASVDPLVAARVIDLLGRGEPLGAHASGGGADDVAAELAALHELPELLPLDRPVRRQLARLFAVGRWLAPGGLSSS